MGIAMIIAVESAHKLLEESVAKLNLIKDEVYRDATPEEYYETGDQFIKTGVEYKPYLIIDGRALEPRMENNKIISFEHHGSIGSWEIGKTIYSLLEEEIMKTLKITFDHDVIWTSDGWVDKDNPTSWF